jgi:hypothetical protein
VTPTTTEAPKGLLVPCDEIVYGRVCGMPARVAKATDPFRRGETARRVKAELTPGCAKHAGEARP